MRAAGALVLGVGMLVGAARAPVSTAPPRGQGTVARPKARVEAVIGSLAWSPDGGVVVSAADDGTILVHDAASGRSLRRWETNTRGATHVWFTASGERLLSVGDDWRARVWEVQSGLLERTAPPPRTVKVSLPLLQPFAHSADGTRFASSRESWTRPTGDVVIVDAQTGRQESRLHTTGSDVSALAFSTDGARLAAVVTGSHGASAEGMDETLWLWELGADPRLLARSAISSAGILELAFSPDGRSLAAGGGTVGGGEVHLWEIPSLRLARRWTFDSDAVYALAFSPDGTTLFAAGRFTPVRAWSRSTGRLRHRFPRIADSVVSLAVSPDGTFLAQGSGWRDTQVALWDLTTFARVW